MKRLFLLPLVLCFFVSAMAQGGYHISITLKPYKAQYVYLGYYYGNKKALADSTLLGQDSKGLFNGNKPLPGGIYFIVSPQKQILFELLIDRDQDFTIEADSAHLADEVRFEQTSENDLFRQYSLYANKVGRLVLERRQALATEKKHKDSLRIEAQLKGLGRMLKEYRDSLAKAHPNTFLSVLFKAMQEPSVPPAAEQPGGKYDSAYAFRYFKSHYWDGVSFDDGRLVRTPFFEARLDQYFRDLVSPDPDSIIREADHMLLYSRTSEEMYKFLMVYFVQKYINPQYMGQDAVFVHLFEKYINTGQAAFFTDRYRDFINKRAYSVMANLIGQQAANLEMVDSLDKPRPLYDVQSDYIVICFWDPTCSHCKETVPKLDSIYEAKWKKEGVTMYGVMVDGGRENWVNFIRDHNLKDWIHVYQLPSQAEADEKAGKPGFRQLYDVYQTPMLYLLDKNKRIIAKKLDYQQLDQILDLKLKQSGTQ